MFIAEIQRADNKKGRAISDPALWYDNKDATIFSFGVFSNELFPRSCLSDGF